MYVAVQFKEIKFKTGFPVEIETTNAARYSKT